MKIILDSNIIVADFWMDSPAFLILLESSKAGNIDLYFPKVVVDEVKNKFRQRIAHAQSTINGEIGKLNRLTRLSIGKSLSESVMKKFVKKYEKHFDQVIKDNNITILPYPDTSHEYLARKARLKLKPFNENEKGYRDNLIWETIKKQLSAYDEELPATPEVIFITANYTDFGESEQLHNDLFTELEEEGFHPDGVFIYTSLKEYNEKVVKLSLAMAVSFQNKIKGEKWEELGLKEYIDAHLYEEYNGSEIYHYHGLAPYANAVPMVSGFNDDYKIGQVSVRKLNPKEYIVDIKIDLETELDYYIDKHDYYGSDELLDVSVIEEDWNDHVVAVSRTVDVPVEITVVVDSKLECISIEIDKINGEYNSVSEFW